MDLPLVNITGDITFSLQSGLIRDEVNINTSKLNLKSLKDLACNFIDKKYPEHGLNKLDERLMLFKHEYSSTNMLLPINIASEVTNGSLIEVVVSLKDPSNNDELSIRPHHLKMHSYMSPTFCDFCAKMLFGLVKQGLKCEGCGLNYHKKCAYKIPNNCIYGSRRRSSAHLIPNSPTNETVQRTASSGATLPEAPSFLSSPSHDRRASAGNEKSFSLTVKPNRLDKRIAEGMRIPHTFVVHSYVSPTICQWCKKLLKGIIRQGYQCKDCKFNAHKKCMKDIPSTCTGEIPSDYGEGEDSLEKDTLSDSDNETESPEKPRSIVTDDDDNESDNQPITSTESNNIPLMRIVQSVKHNKRRGSEVIKEGWMVHFTSKDSMKKRHFWRLDTKAITMYQNENSSNYYREIILSDILSIFPSKNGDCGFEMRTTHLNYYCGEPGTATAWELAIRQALMPVADNKAITSIKETDAFNRVGLHAGENRVQTDNDISLQYQIFPDEVLGSGQFGIVYGGVHRITRRAVAIKVIDKSRFPTKQEAQLKNEVSILENLHHPGVVTLEKMFETKDRIYVVMEKLKGDMLDMILHTEKKRLDERVTKFLIYQILIALKHLHSQNIVHCDLKPENVLLSSDADYPLVKLCDFGFARIIGERCFRRSVVGTPAYLAPEVIRNKRYNRSLDMWSVGVIVYVSLSGTFPFNEEEDINDQIQNAAFMYPNDPWKEISAEAIDLITNLLQVKSKNRYTVDKSLCHPWLEDYQTWCDLRDLEKRMGQRWLTHESDDARWESYGRQSNLYNNYRGNFTSSSSKEFRSPLPEELGNNESSSDYGYKSDSSDTKRNGANPDFINDLDKLR
ncbi:serine/threonine-protein kinase D1 [Tetranychus urticae]|uniref:protein kinase C n=1 Tax=Tetranychus urticae TaxID=32264 RepID=T1K800_TETUR|nr:serine/threonine-protein kinase D1 [Tetranychus urticae]